MLRTIGTEFNATVIMEEAPTVFTQQIRDTTIQLILLLGLLMHGTRGSKTIIHRTHQGTHLQQWSGKAQLL